MHGDRNWCPCAQARAGQVRKLHLLEMQLCGSGRPRHMWTFAALPISAIHFNIVGACRDPTYLTARCTTVLIAKAKEAAYSSSLLCHRIYHPPRGFVSRGAGTCWIDMQARPGVCAKLVYSMRLQRAHGDKQGSRVSAATATLRIRLPWTRARIWAPCLTRMPRPVAVWLLQRECPLRWTRSH